MYFIVILTRLLTLGRYAIATRKSYSHILQVAISLGQLYGTAVYYITSYLEGDNFAASSFHYNAYYIFANSFWVWIPTLIVIRCWKKICAAIKAKDQKQLRAKNRWYWILTCVSHIFRFENLFLIHDIYWSCISMANKPYMDVSLTLKSGRRLLI